MYINYYLFLFIVAIPDRSDPNPLSKLEKSTGLALEEAVKS